MATTPLEAEVSGADRIARAWLRAADKLDELLERELRELGEDAEVIFAAHALRRTGRLARGIYSAPFAGGVVVRAEARDPKTGYDYVGITRFGHRDGIYPIRAKALSWVTADGRRVFARYSRGFHPTSDWAERAMPQVQTAVTAATTRLGRRIEALF